MNTLTNNTTPNVAPEEPAKEVQETLSTVSMESLKEDQKVLFQDGKYLLTCNICNKCSGTETDASQMLQCGHAYLQKPGSTDKCRFANKMDEYVFRMKAVMQGNDDVSNKRLVDNFYEQNDEFMQKYPMYGRYKTGLQNMALFKKTEKVSAKNRWSRVRSKIKSLTWIYKTV